MRRLRNTTQLPDALLRELAAFAVPPGKVGTWDLEVRNGSWAGVSGMAYTQGSSYHSTARPFITLRVGPAKYPQAPRRARRAKAGYLPEPWYANQVDAVLFVLAHELRHLWQRRVPRGRRVWGARGQMSERDADAYALSVLRAWRKR